MSLTVSERWNIFVVPYLKYVYYEVNRRVRFGVAHVTRRCPECALRRPSHKMDCGRWRGMWGDRAER